MAGRYSIQRFANGLLPLLGMQVGGDGPAELEPNVRAILDVLPFYMQDRLRVYQSSTININAVGQWTLTQIPQGEQWLLLSASAQVTQAAATTGTYRFALNRASLSPATLYGLGQSSSLPAAGFCNLGWHFERPIIMRPGDQWGLIAEQYTGAGNSAAFANGVYVALSQ